MAERTQYVTTVNPKDVLFGRGSGPNDHEGNIEFRKMVAQRKDEYMSTNNRQTKATIAKEIVDTVYNAQGRFLKKLEASDLQKLGLPSATDVYQIVDGDTVMEKAKQALRQNRDKREMSDSKPSSKPQKAAKPQIDMAYTQNPYAPGLPTGITPHDNLEPLPVQGNLRSILRDTQDQQGHPPDHVQLVPINDYSTYTAQLEEMANQDKKMSSFNGLNSNEKMSAFNRLNSNEKMSSFNRLNSNGSLDMNGVFHFTNTPSAFNTPSSRRSSRKLMKNGSWDGLSEMMNSFKEMSTGDLNSVDSIGTIDAMFPQGAASQVTGMSNMSISSLFKGRKKSDDSLLSMERNGRGMRNASFKNIRANHQGAMTGQSGQNALWNALNEQPLNVGMGMEPPPNRPTGAVNHSFIAQTLMNEPLHGSNNNMDMHMSHGGPSSGMLSHGMLSQGTMTSMMSLQSISEKQPVFDVNNTASAQQDRRILPY